MNLPFSDGLQPAEEKECLVETARGHVAPWGMATARGFASAYQTLTAVPVPVAGLGVAVKEVSTTALHLHKQMSYIIIRCYKCAFFLILSACDKDMYGPDCRLSCKCQNGGVCNRFSGCQCPTGWRGQNCEKSGRCHHIHVHPLCLPPLWLQHVFFYIITLYVFP